jgi:hypothetical protein
MIWSVVMIANPSRMVVILGCCFALGVFAEGVRVLLVRILVLVPE